MSTVTDTVVGKGRNMGTNFWLIVLAISLVVFGANTGYATWKAARLGGASTSASNLQLNSQRLANQGREAVEGDRAAFTAFKATKAEVDSDIAGLNSNFGSTTGVSGPIAKVRSEEHTSELQSLMRISYAVFCLKKKKTPNTNATTTTKYRNKPN